MVNIKSHKGRGDVSFRAIHGAQASPLKPGMRLISRWLQPHIDQRPHILKDVFDLVTFLKSTKFDHDVWFLKTDVKDFFMSGGHEELTSLTAGAVESGVRKHYIALTKLILGAQYLECASFPQELWKIVRGSGMGLICSGSISDVAFDRLAEQDWATDKEVQRRHCICAYRRFKDDVLIIGNGTREQRHNFFQTYCHNAKFYRLNAENCSRSEVQMLELLISKGPKFAKSEFFNFKVVRKSSSLWQPVRSTSMHLGSVHKSWTVGMEKRFRLLCSS